VQYRVRWKGDPADGSLDEWFSLEDIMREYPEEIVLYEGELVQKERESKEGKGGREGMGGRRNSLANRRRQSAASIFESRKSVDEVEADVKVSLFVLSEVRRAKRVASGACGERSEPWGGILGGARMRSVVAKKRSVVARM
jgi:hypothetical protein